MGRHVDTPRIQSVANFRHCRSGVVAVYRDVYQLGTRLRQLRNLSGRRLGRVGIGHGLHDYGRILAYLKRTDHYCLGTVAANAMVAGGLEDIVAGW